MTSYGGDAVSESARWLLDGWAPVIHINLLKPLPQSIRKRDYAGVSTKSDSGCIVYTGVD
jgi:hypothetical protein